MWLLVGVLALLGGQPSVAGTWGHDDHGDRARPGAPAVRTFVRQYAALGDSFTAGSGMPAIEDADCQRSARNYPHLLAAAVGARLDDASCGGARTVDVQGNQPSLGEVIPPQLASVGPGTDLVTIALGLNDAGYGPVVFGCWSLAAQDPQGAPCRDSFRTSGGDSVAAILPDVRARLLAVVKAVRSRAPDAEIVLVGYPQPVPQHGTCAELPFATGDYDYVRRFFANVDGIVEQVARQSGVRYLDMLAASRGHSTCSDEPWVAGAESSSTFMPFHPKPRWHRAVTAMLIETLTETAR